MDITIIKEILNLKEKEGYSILRLGIKNEEQIRFSIERDEHFSEIFTESLDEITMLSVHLSNIYKKEVAEDLTKLKNEELLALLNISVIANEEGNTISMYVPYVRIYKEGADELIELVKKIQHDLDEKLNKILSQFVDSEDSIKEFELALKKDSSGDFKYHDFNRMTDRKISQQKSEVRELLSLGFEKKLITKAYEMGYDLYEIEDKEIIFIFNTDMKEILDLKIGTFR